MLVLQILDAIHARSQHRSVSFVQKPDHERFNPQKTGVHIKHDFNMETAHNNQFWYALTMPAFLQSI